MGAWGPIQEPGTFLGRGTFPRGVDLYCLSLSLALLSISRVVCGTRWWVARHALARRSTRILTWTHQAGIA